MNQKVELTQKLNLHHNNLMADTCQMRTSVTLDEDVHSFVSTYAEAKGISLSAAIVELVRKAEHTPESGTLSPKLKISPHGYLVIANTGDTLTPQMVKDASEDPLV